MKKKLCFISLLIGILTLSACGKERDNNVAIINQASGECQQSVIVARNSIQLAIGPEGYYGYGGFGVNGYLTYISKSNAKETYLCSKPECSHVDEWGFEGLETCNAYIGSTLPRSVVYYNGYLYLLEYNRDTYEVTLVKISADGSVHEKIMVVGESPNQASNFNYLFVDDTTIYMIYSAPDYTGEECTISLDKIDLKKKEKTSVYTYTGESADIGFLKVLDKNIFFTKIKRDEDNYYNYLMRYDMEQNETYEVLEDNICSYTLAKNGQLFYYIPMDGLYRCDLQTMKTKLIRKCDEESMQVLLAYDGTYLYLDNSFNDTFNEESKSQVFVCDVDGNLVNTIPMEAPILEISDQDYMLAQELSNEGRQWVYIKKTDITDPSVTWSKVSK